ncbi:MAG: carboxypeptidase-like regulatory domain-containing protein [Acidobacteria bacterium]|jgi:protocatechuate 3,4-dioxygenase beta subunit|nr:carboxypeptidase-like regulatory domain-containing protein [Acidobacteriota bacterium]
MSAGLAIEGQVFDARTSRPLAGAEILVLQAEGGSFSDPDRPDLFARSAKTAKDGRFRVDRIAIGRWLVQAVAEGHARDERLVAVAGPPAPPLPPTLFFLDIGSSISGVVSGPGGKPAAGVKVWIYPSGSTPRMSKAARLRPSIPFPAAVTDDRGRFVLRGVPEASEFTVYARHETGPVTQLPKVTVAAGGSLEGLALQLKAGATLTATLLGAEDDPLSARITLMTRKHLGGSEGGRGSWLNAGPSIDVDHGALRVAGLEPGRFDLALRVQGYQDVVVEAVELVDGETRGLGAIRTVSGATLEGIVVDGAGKGLAGVSVTASMKTAGLNTSKEERTDGDGRFRISGLVPAGTVHVTAKSVGWLAPKPQEVIVHGERVTIALEPAASVTGTVVAGVPPRPVPTFSVRALPKDGAAGAQSGMFRAPAEGPRGSFADETGKFTLSELGAGDYNLTVEADGFVPALVDVKLAQGESRDVGNVALDRGATLTGRAVEKRSKAPVPGATVRLAKPGLTGFMQRLQATGSGDGIPTVLAGADGTFRMSGVPPGPYLVQADSERLSPGEASVLVEQGIDPDPVTIELLEGGVVQGTFRNKEGNPVAGATIMAAQGGFSDMGNMTTTDASGRYRLDNLAPGEWTLMFASPEEQADGSPESSMPELEAVAVKVESGETTNVSLPPGIDGIRVRGVVRRGDRPVVASVQLMKFEGSAADVIDLQTDSSGAYSMTVRAPGRYLALIDFADERAGSGSEDVRAVVEVPPNVREATLDLVIPDATLRGRVLDGDTGGPMSGAQLFLARLEENGEYDADSSIDALRRESDAEGRFEFSGVAAGRHRLGAVQPGYGIAIVQEVTVGDKDPPEQQFLLLRAHPVTVRVVSPQGTPIEGALVLPLLGSQEMMLCGQSTREDGVATLRSLPDGGVDLAVSASGYGVVVLRNIQVGAETEGEQKAVLEPENVLAVTVQDAGGKPVQGATIARVALQDGPDLAMVLGIDAGLLNKPRTSGPDGRILIGGLAAGRYRVEVAAGEKRSSVKVKVEDGKPAAATVALP